MKIVVNFRLPVFGNLMSALELVDRMYLKLLTSGGIVYGLESLYPVGILTQLVSISLNMFFAT